MCSLYASSPRYFYYISSTSSRVAWARTSIHVQEYGTRHQHDFHLTPYFLESVLHQSLQPRHFSNSAIARRARWGFANSRFPQLRPTCKANSNARPQTDLRFSRILSVWVGQWGRVRAIFRMRWPCTQRTNASRPRTFFLCKYISFFHH